MGDVLLTRHARALRSLTRPRWLRHALAWTIFIAAGVVVALHAGAAPPAACTDDAPCQPDSPTALISGLLVAAAVAGLLQARVAAWLAGAFAIAVVGYDLLHPALASPSWVYGADVAFVALCFGVAGITKASAANATIPDAADTNATIPDATIPDAAVDGARAGSGTAMTWLAGVHHDRPPPPRELPRTGQRWWVAWVTCALVALGLATWALVGQAWMDARQRAASRTVGEVTAQVDAATVRVRLPDGRLTDVDVLSARDHPVGRSIPLYTDEAGLRQPVSEPYDLTGLLILAVVAAGTGLACRVRGAERAAGLRALFEQPQPVTQVYVRAGWGLVAVYPADARPGEPAIAEIRCLPMTQALLDAVPADDPDDHRLGLLPTRPALLYGIPAPGRWCTVVVNGEAAAPTRPLRTTVDAPSFTEPADADWPAPSATELPLRAEEVEALDPADRDRNPNQVHTHSPHRAFGYAMSAAMPLVLVVPARLLPTLPYRTALVIAGLATAVTCLIGWRLFLRSRLAWNAGGVAVVGAIGSGRFRWQQVRRIQPDRHDVTIGTSYRSLVVAAPDGAGVLTGRSAEQLANALRYARERAVPDVDPPRLATPTPPAGLYALWLVTTPLVAWALQAFNGW